MARPVGLAASVFGAGCFDGAGLLLPLLAVASAFADLASFFEAAALLSFEAVILPSFEAVALLSFGLAELRFDEAACFF